MGRPDLPEFDPTSASESNAGASAGTRAAGTRRSMPGGRSGSAESGTDSRGRSESQSGSNSSPSGGRKERKSPMADVWDDSV